MAATAAKLVARDALIALLRQDALYVQGVIQPMSVATGMAALLSSGFDAVSTNRAQQPLATPQVFAVENDGTGRLQIRLNAVPNARIYEVLHKSGMGGWTSAGMFQSTRQLVVTGLTPGVMYTFQVRAVGGSTGSSQWSDPVSHMSL